MNVNLTRIRRHQRLRSKVLRGIHGGKDKAAVGTGVPGRSSAIGADILAVAAHVCRDVRRQPTSSSFGARLPQPNSVRSEEAQRTHVSRVVSIRPWNRGNFEHHHRRVERNHSLRLLMGALNGGTSIPPIRSHMPAYPELDIGSRSWVYRCRTNGIGSSASLGDRGSPSRTANVPSRSATAIGTTTAPDSA